MEQNQRMIVVDVEIPFTRLVLIMIKFGLAAIPAAIIVSIIVSVIMAFIGGLFGGMGGLWMHGGRSL
ncbi:hypothetical protein [Polymorphum gilvum]|uniref:hypothetical protein n=1 Tax=Polymorphum gilvum TaxID=991904 RepID=UPI00059D1661|nr:hypothetical protein [Polymorphum gilvum]